MGDIIKAARDWVPGFYKLSISQGNNASAQETVKNNIEWLLLDSHFLFGEVSLVVRSISFIIALLGNFW